MSRNKDQRCAGCNAKADLNKGRLEETGDSPHTAGSSDTATAMAGGTKSPLVSSHSPKASKTSHINRAGYASPMTLYSGCSEQKKGENVVNSVQTGLGKGNSSRLRFCTVL